MGVAVLFAGTASAADTDWFEEGRRYQEGKNYAQAIDCFNKAIEESPDDVRAWNHLAICYLEARNLDETVEVSKLAVDKWPNNIIITSNYAFIISVKAECDFEKYVAGEISKEAYVEDLNNAIAASQNCLDVLNAKPEGFNYKFRNSGKDVSLDERKEQIENEIIRFKVRINHIEAFGETPDK